MHMRKTRQICTVLILFILISSVWLGIFAIQHNNPNHFQNHEEFTDLLGTSTVLDWDPSVNLSIGASSYNVFVGDANNDGYSDIVTPGSTLGELSIYLWNVSTGTWDSEMTKSVGANPYKVFIGDANNDGYNDILAINSGDDNVSIFLWNTSLPTPTWDAEFTLPAGDNPRGLFVGDANNDGYNDIVTCFSNAQQDVLVTTWNSTTKDWDLPGISIDIGVTNPWPYHVFVGDANNDGQNDIVAVNQNEDSISILLWNITTRNWNETIKPVGNQPFEVFIGDCNNDGYNDIMTGNRFDNNVSIYLWNITSSDWDYEWRPVGTSPRGIFIGDANNDGQNDIVTADASDHTVSLLLWNVSSSDWDSRITRPVGTTPYGVFVADANNDGQNDIVTVNYNDNEVSVLVWNATPGDWNAETTLDSGIDPYRVAIGDANNDGQNDIVVANWFADSVSILPWNLTSNNWDTRITRTVGSRPNCVVIGDANNDGENDIVTTNYNDDDISVLLWNDTIMNWNPQLRLPSGAGPDTVSVSDVNNDGQNDIVVSESNMTIYTWNVTTQYWNPVINFTCEDSPVSSFVGDANNDGLNDIVYPHILGTEVSVHTWNDTLGDWDAAVNHTVGSWPNGVFVGDANNDGENDILVVSRASGDKLTIIAWNETQTDWDAPVTKIIGDWPMSVSVGDANNDGQNEIVTVHRDDDDISIISWNETLKDWGNPINKSVGNSPYHAAIGDANNDGQNDIVVANTAADNVSIFTWTRIDEPILDPFAPSLYGKTVELNWSAVEGATRYYIYRDTKNITHATGLAAVGSTTQTSYNDTVSTSGFYYYAIVAGYYTQRSPVSNNENVTVDAIPPHTWNFSFPSTETKTTGNITIELTDDFNVSDVLIYINNTDFGTQNVSITENGTHYWYTYIPMSAESRNVTFYMNDSVGNWNTSSYLITNIFFSPPISENFSYPTTENGTTANITIQVVDNVDVSHVLIYINHTDFTPNQTMTYNGTHYWIEYTPTTVEVRNVTFYMNDTSDNWNSTSYQINNIYISPPNSTNFYSPASIETGIPRNITVQVADDNGVSNVYISINHTDLFPQNQTMTSNGTHYWYTYTPRYTADVRNVTFYMRDVGGNWNSSSYLISNVPYSPPTYSNLVYPTTMANGTINEIILYDVTDNTNLLAPNPVNISLYGLANVSMIPIGQDRYRLQHIPLTPGLSYNFMIYIFDEFGNVNVTTRFFNVTVDVDAPTWSNKATPDVLQNQRMTISIRIDDNTAIKNVLIYITGSDFPSAPNNASMTYNTPTGLYTYSYVPNTPGSKSYTIFIEDVAENWNATSGTFLVIGLDPLLEFFLRFLLLPIATAVAAFALGLFYQYTIKPRIRKGKLRRVLTEESQMNVVELKDKLGLESKQLKKIAQKLRDAGKIKGSWNRNYVTFYNEEEILNQLHYYAKKNELDLGSVKIDQYFLREVDFPDEELGYIMSLVKQLSKRTDIITPKPVAPVKAQPSKVVEVIEAIEPELEVAEPAPVEDADYTRMLADVSKMATSELLQVIENYRQDLMQRQKPNMEVLKSMERWIIDLKYYPSAQLSENDARLLARELLKWEEIL